MAQGDRLRLGLLFGGRSGEHAVSILSARSVLAALDPSRYEVTAIAIDRRGRWYTGEDPWQVLEALAAGSVEGLRPVTVVPQPGHPANPLLDVAFPLLHGPLGEDGTIQSIFELAEIPYVGAGVAASAVGMDKALMKAAFRAAGLPIVPYRVVSRSQWGADPEAVVRAIAEEPGFPVFVKPANLGSSVGVGRAGDAGELRAAIQEALRYDRKALVEASAAPAREIECSVLGLDEPRVSVPGEVQPGREFYDYEAKYHDAGTRLLVPAPLEPEVERRVRELAARAFAAIGCEGMARVDFFVRPGGEVLVNEINTIPGFTAVSMYPRLWEASGLPYPQLLDRLVEIALAVHEVRLEIRAANAEYRLAAQGGGVRGPKSSG